MGDAAFWCSLNLSSKVLEDSPIHSSSHPTLSHLYQLHIHIRPYWSYKDDLTVIDSVVMKGRCIIIPEELKQQVLDQLHVNHMGIKKTKLLVHKSVYWVNIKNDIENHVKNCSTCFKPQQTQPKEKTIHHDILLRPWEVIGVDVFQLNNKNYLCVVDYHSNFSVIKRMEGLSAESLIATVKIIFAEYGIPHRLMLDAGSNFISEKFRSFCNSLNIEQAVSSSYHYQSNGQVEACIKFIKHTIKNADTPVVIYTWHCCKLEPQHLGKVSQAQQHCYLIAQ